MQKKGKELAMKHTKKAPKAVNCFFTPSHSMSAYIFDDKRWNSQMDNKVDVGIVQIFIRKSTIGEMEVKCLI